MAHDTCDYINIANVSYKLIVHSNALIYELPALCLNSIFYYPRPVAFVMFTTLHLVNKQPPKSNGIQLNNLGDTPVELGCCVLLETPSHVSIPQINLNGQRRFATGKVY